MPSGGLLRVIGCAALALLWATLPAAAAKRMFVTSASGNGNLSSWPQAGGHTGLAAGDAICQSLAAAAGLADASLFRAWLSTSTTDAYCHVAGFSGKKSATCGQGSLPDAGPWQRTDGVSFSHRLSDLTTTFDILHPPLADENGNVDPLDWTVFTATSGDGTFSNAGQNAACNGWQSASNSQSVITGRVDAGALAWTAYSSWTCDQILRLLCFDPGTGGALPNNPASPGAWVFVTSASGPGDLGLWPQAGGSTGVAAGDAICRNLATAGHLPAAQTYVAWLSVAGSPAIARITTDGPFRRPGGVQIAASKAGLLASPFLESDVEADDLGDHLSEYVATGSDSNGQPTGDDCSGWTDAGAGATFSAGRSSFASSKWTTGLPGECALSGTHLLCFSNVVILFADGFESGNTSAWSASAP
jgi:hypothetical protein